MSEAVEPETAGGPAGGNAGFRFSPRPNRAAEIAWRPWGTEAFEEAEREGKLVLLSISAVWCHWCHVMDETTYSGDEVIERVNRDFIPVRVDSDQRPDINKRYNQGGWPTTAFLVPSGRAIAGLTYSPPERLTELLEQLVTLYRDRRDQIEVEAGTMVARERAMLRRFETGADPDPEAPAKVIAATLSQWDREYGGLGTEPKFPHAGSLELAMARHLETGDEDARDYVTSTLDGMSAGGLEDRVEGGFFRYSTVRDWSVPHYEKMLVDNAELITIYLQASVALDRPDYAETARRALEYVLAKLLDEEQCGFYGSQDADESYYLLDREGRAALAPPAVDPTIYTDSSARMVSALVTAAAVLEDPELLVVAKSALDFLWHEGFRHGTGVMHYCAGREGVPRLAGMAADQVYLLQALADMYQATGEPAELERAVELAELIVERYQAERGWLGDLDTDETGEPGGGGGGALSEMPSDLPDLVLNGDGARALLVMEALAPGRGLGEAAGRALAAVAPVYEGYTYFAAGYAMAVDMFARGPIEVRLGGDRRWTLQDWTLRESLRAFQPRKVVRAETLEDFAPVEGDAPAPPVVVCSTERCVPVERESELAGVLATLGRGQT